MNASLRVLMVGRDDIERSLRRDPTLEILRARSATDAIGELGLASIDGEAAPICVLLAPGVVDAQDEAGWLNAMRSVQPAARFASLGGTSRPGFDGRLDWGYDGVLLYFKADFGSRAD